MITLHQWWRAIIYFMTWIISNMHCHQFTIHRFATSWKFISRVSCQKGPTRHAYAWQIGPFWQDTLNLRSSSSVWKTPLGAAVLWCGDEVLSFPMSIGSKTFASEHWRGLGIVCMIIAVLPVGYKDIVLTVQIFLLHNYVKILFW